MRILEGLIQGTDAWKEVRGQYKPASLAPVMMGAAKHTSRSELIRMISTGAEKEFSDWFRDNVLEAGHVIEAAARPIAEVIVGEDLYPVTGVNDELGLLASFDGLTMLGDVVWECKSFNQAKAAKVKAGEIPEEDIWQVIQQLVVSGAEKALYMVTDGTEEKTVYCWYSLKPGDADTLIAHWEQFAADLAAYVPEPVKPEAVADPQEALPAIVVQVSGSLAITDNLDVFGKALTRFVDNLNLAPKTDQDFANLEAATKALKKAEDALTSEEDRALAQADSIEALRRTVAQYRELARTTRLRAEKVVKAEKENRRNEIRIAAVEAFRAHIDQINATLGGRVRLPEIAIDVTGAMKGKKTISSLEDAAATEVARAKIEANRVADEYRKNLAILDAEAKGYEFLFHDTADLVTINPEHLPGVIRGRIADYKEAEQRKLEAERERIRREEEDKAQRDAEVKAEQERERIRAEEQEKAKAEAAKQAEATVEPEKPVHQAAPQPAAPSGTVNVVGIPEFDSLLDHIYEYGTGAEGVIEKANAFARAVIARYAPQKPAPDVSALVEALEQCITSMLDSGYRADAVVIRAARAALAAYHKGSES